MIDTVGMMVIKNHIHLLNPFIGNPWLTTIHSSSMCPRSHELFVSNLNLDDLLLAHSAALQNYFPPF